MDYPIRTKLCIEHLRRVMDIPGDVIELGVGRGTTTFPLAIELKGSDKKLYACDTFEGLPAEEQPELYPAASREHILQKGECRGVFGMFEKMMFDHKVNGIIRPLVGLFENTLDILRNERFCFAWLDADLYSSTLTGYKFLEDRITPGGILGFHDYKFIRCPGVDMVIDTVLDHDKFKKIEYRDGCIFFKKSEGKQ